ncbi:MAG: trans-acting enoyl reductase family protein [Pseudomonadales bacterium]
MTNENKYDVVIFGASSFVGQLIARYMSEEFSQKELRWAMAGRSTKKLETLRTTLTGSPPDILLADSEDETALRAMCEKTNVVLSTVGPYALYGDLLVELCVETGTHYCDLTGETQWVKRMQDAYAASALESGARIVHCCGFDSIPSDLGVHYLQQRSLEQFGKTCSSVKMGVANLKGGVSGGTVASVINLTKEASKDSALRKELADDYSMCPPNHGFTTRQHSVKIEYDEDFESWLAPFVMAGVNTRVVHRSNALSGNSYGDAFKYHEAMMTGNGAAGKSKARTIRWGLGSFVVSAALAPTRWLLERTILPKPGEGPSEYEQASGSYHLKFVGTTDDGESIRCEVKGDRDPGYGSTAKMVSQAAVCLALDVADDVAGGFWTPATLFGDKLIGRLQEHAGVTFAEVDVSK